MSKMVGDFFRTFGSLTVKEVPGFLKKRLTVANLKKEGDQFLTEYKAEYIDTGSAQPIFHMIGGIFIIGYITAWPTEYRHMMAKRHGHH